MKDARAKKRPTRLRGFVIALILTLICGTIEFGEPLEDLLRGMRNSAHQRDADGRTVIVSLDNPTFDNLGLNFSEKYDATLIERLMASGVNRIYFDQMFHDIHDEAGANELITTIKRYPGRVYFGIITTHDESTLQATTNGPASRYLPYVSLASLNGKTTPFSLSSELNYSDEFNNTLAPSISASIAGVTHAPGSTYRPDWTILYKTIRTISYINVLNADRPIQGLRGKDVIIGPMTSRIPDQRPIIGQSWVPGVYFHAIGAQTLREGTPLRASWLYPYLAAIALSWFTFRARKTSTVLALYVASTAGAIVIPFITDHFFITIDYVPAYLLYGAIAYQSNSYRQKTRASRKNNDSQLPNLYAFRSDISKDNQLIAALIINNYERILSAYPDLTSADLIAKIIRPITLAGATSEVYHDDSTLYWTLPHLEIENVSDHIKGLHKLIATVRIPDATVDIDFAIGIDAHYDAPIAKRINEAKIAALNAASAGITHSFSVTTQELEQQWQLSLMSELDDAITDKTITVAYQPQLHIRTDSIVGAEALVRWNHPTRGPISPAQFIAQAEQTNRIEALTYYVLEQSLREMRSILQFEPSFAIAINLSAKLIANPDLPERISLAATAADFPLQSIKLEVTETAALTTTPAATKNLALLREAGVKISIDDYGTGNATLEYLRNIPFDELKIDREFVTDLTTSDRDRLLVKSTIALAHALGKTVTAEGIEDSATLTQLRHLKCDHAQGFFVSKPIPADELIQFLHSDNSHQRRTRKKRA